MSAPSKKTAPVKEKEETGTISTRLEEDIFGKESDDELSDYELPDEEEEEETAPAFQQDTTLGDASYDPWQRGDDDDDSALPDIPKKGGKSKSKAQQETSAPRTADLLAGLNPDISDEARNRFAEAREFMDSVEKEVRGTGKRKRTRPADEHDLTAETKQDSIARILVDKMREAAAVDDEAIRRGEPATERILLLEEVCKEMRKAYLHPALMDAGITESIRAWLEPNSQTRALPTIDVQTEMMNILDELPVETEHIRISGIGRLIKFYGFYKKVPASVKRLADRLIIKWSRPIMGRSDDYHSLARHRAYGDDSAYQQAIPTIEPALRYEPQPGEPGYSAKARIPIHFAPTYNVAPEIDPQVMAELKNGRGATKDEQRSRMSMVAKGRKVRAKE